MNRYCLCFGFLFVLAVISSGVMAQDRPSEEKHQKWGPYLDAEGKIGSKRNLGELDLFLPVLQNDTSLVFANLRGRADNESSREGNLGMGVRHMLKSGWNLGAYGYFDHRRSPYDNYFNQATVGIEALSMDWDARINAYAPLGDRIKNVDSLNTATLSGSTVTFRGGEEHALSGFDGEVGWRVPVFGENADSQLRVYLGGYRFTASGVPDVTGPRARLDLTIAEIPWLWAGSRLSLGAEIEDDAPRGTQTFASLRLRIPLDLFTGGRSRKLTPMERRMTEPVVRDIDVVTEAGAYGAPETVTAMADGTAFTVLDDSTTTGAALPAAIAAAGANSTVVLSGSFATTATTTVQSGQTIIGGGNLAVRSPSGRTATVSLPGATVSATTTGVSPYTNPAFALASNSTLKNLNISLTRSGGNGTVAIYGDGISSATITGNTITGTETGANTGIGLLLINSTNITVTGNTITGATGAGTTAYALGMGLNASATVSGNALSASGGSSNNYVIFINSGTVLPGSTGNVRGSGTCFAAGATGSVYFTDGTHCP